MGCQAENWRTAEAALGRKKVEISTDSLACSWFSTQKMTVVNFSLVTHPIAIVGNRIEISRVKARHQFIGRY